MRYDDLPLGEFAFPGPLRDKLVAAILTGYKCSTTGLLLDYEISGDTVPVPGERELLIDSAAQPVAILETTTAGVCRVGDIDLRHAIDEGEGYTSVAQWRAGHERFWHSPQMREALRDPDFTVTDDTVAVVQRFRVVERIWSREEVTAAFATEITALVAALRNASEASLAQPTRCPPWTVKEELAHTVLACTRLAAMLDAPPPHGPEISPAQYFRPDARFAANANADRVADARGYAASTSTDDLLSSLHSQLGLLPRLAAEPAARLVTTRWSDTMTLTDFLVTRVLELAVHGLDLSDALGLPPWLTDAAADVSAGILTPAGPQRLRDTTGWSRADLLRKTTGRAPLLPAEQTLLTAAASAFG